VSGVLVFCAQNAQPCNEQIFLAAKRQVLGCKTDDFAGADSEKGGRKRRHKREGNSISIINRSLASRSLGAFGEFHEGLNWLID
jgi:hypothetical protein